LFYLLRGRGPEERVSLQQRKNRNGTYWEFRPAARWSSVASRAPSTTEPRESFMARYHPGCGPLPVVFAVRGLNLFQSAFTQWCPMMAILGKADVRGW